MINRSDSLDSQPSPLTEVENFDVMKYRKYASQIHIPEAKQAEFLENMWRLIVTLNSLGHIAHKHESEGGADGKKGKKS